MPEPLGRNFRKVWAASTFSSLGNGLRDAAIPLLTLVVASGDQMALGLVAAASRVPWLLFSLPVGVIADRLPRRRLMILADAGRAIVAAMLTLAVLLGPPLSVWALVAIAFALGVGEVLFETASQSFLPEVVEKDDLGRANGSLYAAQLIAGDFVGLGLGAALFGLAMAAPFAIDAATFAASLLLLLSVRQRRIATASSNTNGASFAKDLQVGLRISWSLNTVRRMAFLSGGLNIVVSATSAVLVALVVGTAGLPEYWYGLALAAASAGGWIASVSADRIAAKLSAKASLSSSLVMIGAGTAVLGLRPGWFVLLLSLFLVGFGLLLWNVITVTYRQRVTPNDYLGRVNSAYRLVSWTGLVVGALVGGLVASVVSNSFVFIVGGLAALALSPLSLTLDLSEADETSGFGA